MDRRMSKLNFNKKENKSSVEIVLQVRDKNGNPTGKTKSFDAENCREAGSWYERQSPKKKKRKRKKKESKK